MGYSSRATSTAHMTRPAAAELIGSHLVEEGAPEEIVKKSIDIVYRRLGQATEIGKIQAYPVASGRTKQYLKKDLYRLAIEYFNVEITDLKEQAEQDNKDISTVKLEDVRDINNIVKLCKKGILEAEQAIDMIESVLSQIKGGLE